MPAGCQEKNKTRPSHLPCPLLLSSSLVTSGPACHPGSVTTNPVSTAARTSYRWWGCRGAVRATEALSGLGYARPTTWTQSKTIEFRALGASHRVVNMHCFADGIIRNRQVGKATQIGCVCAKVEGQSVRIVVEWRLPDDEWMGGHRQSWVSFRVLQRISSAS